MRQAHKEEEEEEEEEMSKYSWIERTSVFKPTPPTLHAYSCTVHEGSGLQQSGRTAQISSQKLRLGTLVAVRSSFEIQKRRGFRFLVQEPSLQRATPPVLTKRLREALPTN